MGYAALNVSSDAVKKVLFDNYPLYIGQLITDGGAADDTVIKRTFDFTNINYLHFSWYAEVGFGLKCSIGGVAKFDNQKGGAGGIVNERIDCTSISGDKILLVEMYDSGATEHCETLVIFNEGE